MADIALIAPYKRMLEEGERLVKERKLSGVSVIEGDLLDGISAAAKAVENGAKVLISRGGTYSMIQYVSPVPVVEIKISSLDIAETLRNLLPVDKTIGVIGFRSIQGCSELLTGLGKRVVYVELHHKDNVLDTIKSCCKAGAQIIVGDAVTCRTAKELGLQCYLIESGAKSLLNAIEEAQRMLQAVNREKELIDRYRTLIDSVHDAVLATDEGNNIIALNIPACSIFGLSHKDMICRPLSEFISYGSVIKEILSGTPFTDEIRLIGNVKVAVSNIPIKLGKKSVGSIAVFQDITEVQTREKTLRLKMIQKGFVAKYSFNAILHKSEKMKSCINVARKFSAYDSTVLIEGQSGVGKELFAQSIHNESRRRLMPFVAVNCAAIPPMLIESTLFGYAEGAFTGGSKGGREGVFELAHTGTLFLDEIGELPIELQGRLLRVVQEHEVMRIGGDSVIPLDFRLICATNRNLPKLVEKGLFREDLLYRINTLNLYVPPLNERPEDIDLLSSNFLNRFNSQYAKTLVDFTPEAADFLRSRQYKGNVRELQNIIERAVIISEGERISVSELCSGLQENGFSEEGEKSVENVRKAAPSYTGQSLDEVESEYIHSVYSQTGNSVAETCRVLGINRTTLWRKLKK